MNDDSDSDPETHAQHSHQLVSAFDHSAGGAISVNGVEKRKEPLVIQGLKNRDWREESRRKRGKNLLPAEVQQARRNGEVINGRGKEGDVERDEVSRRSGLQFVAKGEEEKDGEGDVKMICDDGGSLDAEKPAKTADEEALEALMGAQHTSTLVVTAVSSQDEEAEETMNGRAGMNEDDHFRSDVASRPDPASLDDYARVPVEEFGLGMLRGMGWKEGEVVGKRKDQISRARVVERRPALLGIGAKEVPNGVGEELGAWGKLTRGKGNKKVDKTYNPVLLKNSKTGEMLTEDELQAKKERQIEEEREWRERRDRNLKLDEERKIERRRREERHSRDRRRRERSRSSGSGYRSSRRERSRSSDRRRGSSRRERSSSRERRHHSRRRDYDDDNRRGKEHRRREYDDRDDSSTSGHNHKSRDEHNDTRRRRHVV